MFFSKNTRTYLRRCIEFPIKSLWNIVNSRKKCFSGSLVSPNSLGVFVVNILESCKCCFCAFTLFWGLACANSVLKKRSKIGAGRICEKPPFLPKCHVATWKPPLEFFVNAPLCSMCNSVTIYIRGSDMGNNYITSKKLMYFYR